MIVDMPFNKETNKSESVIENEIHKIFWDFEIQMAHQIPARTLDLVLINKKKRTCHLVAFTIPADHRMKIKESEKLDKYLDFTK